MALENYSFLLYSRLNENVDWLLFLEFPPRQFSWGSWESERALLFFDSKKTDQAVATRSNYPSSQKKRKIWLNDRLRLPNLFSFDFEVHFAALEGGSEDPPSLNAFSLAQYDYKLSSGKGRGPVVSKPCQAFLHQGTLLRCIPRAAVSAELVEIFFREEVMVSMFWSRGAGGFKRVKGNHVHGDSLWWLERLINSGLRV